MTSKYYLLTTCVGVVLFVTIIAVTTAQFAFAPINNSDGLPDFELYTSPDLNDLTTICSEYANGDFFDLDINDIVIKKLCSDFEIPYPCLEECEENEEDYITINEPNTIICNEQVILPPDKDTTCYYIKPKEIQCIEPVKVCLNAYRPKSRLKTENIQLILPPTEVEVPKGLEYLKCEVPIECVSTDEGILGRLELCDNDYCRIKKIQDNSNGLNCCLFKDSECDE